MSIFKRFLEKLSGQPAPAQGAGEQAEDEAALANVRRRFAGHLRPAVHLRPGDSGFSRLGGLPDMPENFEWPEWKGKPQAFLAQLDLSAIHAALPSFLPATGYLYFFYDQDQGVWGFDPKDAGGWRVLYSTADRATFRPRPAPDGLAGEFVYQSKAVRPQRIEVLPDTQTLPKSEFDWDRDGEAYLVVREEAFAARARHQVLGLPSPVQNADMERECQLASNGVYVGDSEGYKDPRVPALEAGAAEWKLLLQLDTDDDCGWMWGDVGMLYFWIREQDARAGDFSRVWMVFQCC